MDKKIDDKKFEEISNSLDKVGAEARRDGLYLKNSKKKYTGDALAIYGVTQAEFLAEFNRRLDAIHKEAMQKAAAGGPQGLVGEYRWVTVIDPAISDLPKVGASDKRIFSKIAFAIDEINNETVMCINTHNNEWKALAISGDKISSNISRLTAILSNTDPLDNRYHSYYEQLVQLETAPFTKAVKEFGNRKIKGIDGLVEYISEHYPCSVFCVAYLKLMVKAHTTEQRDPETGKIQEVTIQVPKRGVMAVGDSTKSYSIVRHLVENYPILAADPDFIIDMPVNITNDPNVPSFRYIDLETLTEKGPTPAWDEFFLRYTADEARVMRAYIWSLFVSKNKSRQMLYLYDPRGFSGKSVLQNVIAAYMGDDMVGAIQKDSLSNGFGLAKIWNKRVVFIGDNKNKNIVRSEKIHMALGGDMAEVEYKNRNSFFARLNIRFIVNGNVRPDIDMYATHELTRIIVLKPKVTDEILKKIAVTDKDGKVVYDEFGIPSYIGDPEFEERLKDEFRCMLHTARKDYEELCPTNGNFALPASVQLNSYNCNDDNYSIMDDILTENFVLDHDKWVLPTDMKESFRQYVAIHDVDRSEVTYEHFVEHLEKRYDVTKGFHDGAPKVCGRRQSVYIGIGLKDAQAVDG